MSKPYFITKLVFVLGNSTKWQDKTEMVFGRHYPSDAWHFDEICT